MPRNPTASRTVASPDLSVAVAETLAAAMRPDTPLEIALSMLAGARSVSPEAAGLIDGQLLAALAQRQGIIAESRRHLEGLKQQIDQYRALAMMSGVVVGHGPEDRVLVNISGQERLLRVASGVSAEMLTVGSHVSIAHDGNLVMGVLADAPSGPLVEFVQWHDREHGVVVARHRDEQMLLRVAPAVAEQLGAGDMLVWNRQADVALARVPAQRDQPRQTTEVPNVPVDAVIGLGGQLDTLIDCLRIRTRQVELAGKYGLLDARPPAFLLTGPPGCGKTLLVKAAVTAIREELAMDAYVRIVQPAELYSPFVGESERRTRELFADARGYPLSLIFFDEIDSIGRARGVMGNVHSDRFLGALLAEWDGFLARGSTFIIAASNNADLIDPALMSRFTLTLPVPRPGREAAANILRANLCAGMPVYPNSTRSADTRQRVIDVALGIIFSNTALAGIRTSDGKLVPLLGRHLVSGRMLADLARNAATLAFRRHSSGGSPAGLCEADMAEATITALRQLGGTVSARNARDYLDLPATVHAVGVETAHHQLPVNCHDFVVVEPS